MRTRPTIDYERGLKHCSFCDEWLPLAQFSPSPHKNGGCGLKSYCRACDKIRYPYKPRENPKLQRKQHIFDIRTREELRQCSQCLSWTVITEFFMHGRFMSNLCKPCERKDARERARQNPEGNRAAARAYAIANPEKRKAQVAKWRLNNPERLAEHNHSPEKRARSREYMRQKAATGEAREYQREYARRFPEKGAEKRAARRAKMAGSTVEPVSRTAIIKRDGRQCYLCGLALKWREVTLDHVVSLRRGGSHTATNLRVACGPCNSRKGSKSLDEYAAYLLVAGQTPL